ncbi:hypothetical protein [Demequina sp. NBRC 110053]|uniref:hypothetical protein n=1 Tax=Demequina sp. NBRC 110053 TaxID=1570342 RepID=UPI001184E5F7|nr:hypothetical protein [Demequina sp. NBRC 110053]
MRLRPATPILSRGDGGAQVGLAKPLVLEGLSTKELAFLATLEGGRAIGRLERRTYGTLIAALEASDVEARPPRPRGVARFHSASAIAVDAATALARIGWAVAFADAAPLRRSGVTGARVAPGSSRGLAAAHTVSARVAGADVRAASAPADLEVLVSVGLPVYAARALMAADVPHLLVCTDEQGASVGPVITPGVGPCCTCLGLWATEADAQWPALALQCEGRTPHSDPLVASVAGALVALVASDFAEGRDGSRWRVDEDGVRGQPVGQRHPACACANH